MCFGSKPTEREATCDDSESSHPGQGEQVPGNPNVPNNAMTLEERVFTLKIQTERKLAEMESRTDRLGSIIERVATQNQQTAADNRTLRLREIAIDTAIRNAGSNKSSGTGESEIVKAAKVYFAFLDTGEVPSNEPAPPPSARSLQPSRTPFIG